MEGQKQRHLGKNMRPRGTPESKGMSIDSEEIQEHTTEGHAKKMTPESITESKELTKIEPEAKNGVSDVPLEIPDAPTVAPVDSVFVPERQSVAVNAENEGIFERLMEPRSHLAELMEQSRQESLAVALVGHGLVIPTLEEIEAVLGQKTRDLLHLGDIPTRIPTHEEIDAVNQGLPLEPLTPPMDGPQPNGDYGVVVMIPEQLVSGVLGQAELDGVTPGEWLTPRLAELLEGWFHGA